MKTIKSTFPVLGMGCASCVGKVEKALNSLDGVAFAAVNFAAETATVEYNPLIITPGLLRDAVQKAGYDLLTNNKAGYDLLTDSADKDVFHETVRRAEYMKLKRRVIGAIILCLPLFIIGMDLPFVDNVTTMPVEIVVDSLSDGISAGFWDKIGMMFMDLSLANIMMWFFSTLIVFWFGSGFFTDAWKQLKNRRANMNTLVALSTGIAYIFSLCNMLFSQFWLARGIFPYVYFEASGVIITFILSGRLLEERAKGKTSSAIKKLMGLQPKTVTIVDEAGISKEILINDVKKGDVLLVKPGEKIAVDGTVIDGCSYVDERMLNGEPLPAFKEQGATVIAGNINLNGSFRFRAEKIGADTLLANIIRMVQDAQGSKAPVQQLADKIASVFVPIIMGIALLAFVLWLSLDSINGFTHGLMAAVSVLIIACPCALGLATPTAIMVGIGIGAEKGILIKDTESLETAKKVNVVLFDKTGTITAGKPSVHDLVWLDGDDSAKNIFYSLEKYSGHPLADAVANFLSSGDDAPMLHVSGTKTGECFAWTSGDDAPMLHASGTKTSERFAWTSGDDAPMLHASGTKTGERFALASEVGVEVVPLDNIENFPGKGIKGSFGGKRWFAGSARLMLENSITFVPTLEKRANEWTQKAMTTIWFADEERTLAAVAITDQIKKNSAAAISQLKKLGVKVYMVTGDHEASARETAKKAGIEHYRANVLPHEKALFVKQLQESGNIATMAGDGIKTHTGFFKKRLQESGNIVAMVGDGINDSAALAQADLSIAMGKGSDIAMDTAQMTIISSDLMKIPEAIRLSVLTVRTIRQNLFWAFFYNLIAIPVAAGVLYPVNGFVLNPMIAGLAMALSSITVVANSLRLKHNYHNPLNNPTFVFP